MATGKVKKQSKKDQQQYTDGSSLSVDSKNVKRIKSPNKKDPSKNNDWWKEPKETIASAIQGVVARIENDQAGRAASFVRFARMYGNVEALGWAQTANLSANSEFTNNRMRLNVIQSVIDAAAAKIARDRPKPYFVTSGADFFTRLKASKMTHFAEGVFQENDFYHISDLVFRDAELYGTGCCLWSIKDDKVHCEWVPIIEMRVDNYDGMKKKPRSIHRAYMINKEELQAMYPDDAEAIEGINTEYPHTLPTPQQSVVDMVRVVESWHLPSRKNAKDGLHTVVINDKLLKHEPYTKNKYRFGIFRWYDKPLGWYGRSVTEEIYSIQIEINKLLWTAQNCFELMGVPLIFVENGSEVSEDALLQNFIARMVPYRGTKPVIETPEPLPNSFFQHLQNHIQWAFQIVGLSQTSAASINPLGPDASGAAIREIVDIETTRFVKVGTNWEDFFVDNAEIAVDIAREYYSSDKGKNLEVSRTYRKEIEKIKFKDVDLEDDFEVRCDPVSALPDTVAGRMQLITEYINQQWISKERGMELQNIDPDIEREVNVQTSFLKLIDKRLSQMAEEGIYNHPDEYMLPAQASQALQVSTGVYQLLVAQECPEERLQLVRQWLDELKAMLQPPQPPQQLAPTKGMAPGMATLPPGVSAGPVPPTNMPPPNGQPS